DVPGLLRPVRSVADRGRGHRRGGAHRGAAPERGLGPGGALPRVRRLPRRGQRFVQPRRVTPGGNPVVISRVTVPARGVAPCPQVPHGDLTPMRPAVLVVLAALTVLSSVPTPPAAAKAAKPASTPRRLPRPTPIAAPVQPARA